MNKQITKEHFESIIHILQSQWKDMLSGYFAKNFENKEIILSDNDICEINILLEELNIFEKDETKWNKENMKLLFNKNLDKFNVILDKYGFDNYKRMWKEVSCP